MYLYSLALSGNAIDAFEPIAKWLTVALIALVFVACVIVFFAKKDLFGKFTKYALFVLALYLLALAAVFFALDTAKNYSDESARTLLVPLLVLFCVVFVSVLAYALVSKYNPERKKIVGIVGICISLAAAIAALVCLAVYYGKNIEGDGYYNSDTATVEQLALYIGAILAIAIIVLLAFTDKRKLSFDAHALAYAGICVAMSFALSYIKLWEMPQGGSVTLVSLLPIALFAYLFGAKKGVFVGFVYGLLQAVQDPWIIHPAQFLLDYPVAFSAAGLAGLLSTFKFSEKVPQAAFSVGTVIAGTMRFICHLLSGVFAFEAYAEGQNAWLYSLGYNSYVFVDIALVIAAGVFVLSSKSFIKAVVQAEKTAI